jgi:hypothetical protein
MKRYVIFILILLSAGGLFAQRQDKSMMFSIIGSPHLSWLKSDVKANEKGPVLLGYYAGVEFDYFFEKHYGFSTGINLENTGGSLTYTDEQVIHFDMGADTMAPGTKMTYQLRYIDVPVGLKFTSGEIGYTTIFADVGLNLLVNTKATATATDNNYDREPVAEEIGLFNIGYHVEGGILYSFGNNLSLVVAVEYRNTFLDLTTDLGAPVTDNTYINQLGLKIGLAF